MLPLFNDFIQNIFIIITSFRLHHLFQMGTELGYFFCIQHRKDLNPNVCRLFSTALALLILFSAVGT